MIKKIKKYLQNKRKSWAVKNIFEREWRSFIAYQSREVGVRRMYLFMDRLIIRDDYDDMIFQFKLDKLTVSKLKAAGIEEVTLGKKETPQLG